MKAHLPPDSKERAEMTAARVALAKRLHLRFHQYDETKRTEMIAALVKLIGSDNPFTLGIYFGIDWTMEGCPDEDQEILNLALGIPPGDLSN